MRAGARFPPRGAHALGAARRARRPRRRPQESATQERVSRDRLSASPRLRVLCRRSLGGTRAPRRALQAGGAPTCVSANTGPDRESAVEAQSVGLGGRRSMQEQRKLINT